MQTVQQLSDRIYYLPPYPKTDRPILAAGRWGFTDTTHRCRKFCGTCKTVQPATECSWDLWSLISTYPLALGSRIWVAGNEPPFDCEQPDSSRNEKTARLFLE